MESGNTDNARFNNDSRHFQSLAAIVLAGGKSSRMGQDKRAILIDGTPMLERTLRTIVQISSEVVVVGAFNEERPGYVESIPKLTWLADQSSDQGPLEGFRVGLSYLNRHSSARVALLIGCDYPLFKPAVASRMLKAIANHDAVCIEHQGIRNPVPAIFRVGVLPNVDRLMESNSTNRHKPGIQDVLNSLDVLELNSDSMLDIDPELDSLCNVNNLASLALVNQKLQS